MTRTVRESFWVFREQIRVICEVVECLVYDQGKRFRDQCRCMMRRGAGQVPRVDCLKCLFSGKLVRGRGRKIVVNWRMI